MLEAGLVRSRQISARALLRSGGWTLLSQVLSSITNLALTVVEGHIADQPGFGAFGIAFSSYVVVLAVSHAIVALPLMIARSSDELADRSSYLRGALAVGVGSGVIAGVLLALVGATLGGPITGQAVVMGAMLPGLMWQATWRYQGFVQSSPRVAALADAIWAVAQIALFVTLLLARISWAPAFVAAWGGGALIAAVWLSVRTRFWPKLTHIRIHLEQYRKIWPSLAGEALAFNGISQLSAYSVGAIAGLREVAGLRGSQVLTGLINPLLQAATPIMQGRAARAAVLDARRLRPMLLGTALAGLILVSSYGAALLAMPGGAGRLVLGAAWEATRPLLLPAVIGLAGQWLTAAMFIGLRATQQVVLAFKLRVAISVPLVVAVVWSAAATRDVLFVTWTAALVTLAGAGASVIAFYSSGVTGRGGDRLRGRHRAREHEGGPNRQP